MGVKMTDTTMPDAHESLLAIRMRTEDILDARRDAGPPAKSGRLSV
jgi:pyruvate carboxylase